MHCATVSAPPRLSVKKEGEFGSLWFPDTLNHMINPQFQQLQAIKELFSQKKYEEALRKLVQLVAQTIPDRLGAIINQVLKWKDGTEEVEPGFLFYQMLDEIEKQIPTRTLCIQFGNSDAQKPKSVGVITDIISSLATIPPTHIKWWFGEEQTEADTGNTRFFVYLVLEDNAANEVVRKFDNRHVDAENFRNHNLDPLAITIIPKTAAPYQRLVSIVWQYAEHLDANRRNLQLIFFQLKSLFPKIDQDETSWKEGLLKVLSEYIAIKMKVIEVNPLNFLRRLGEDVFWTSDLVNPHRLISPELHKKMSDEVSPMLFNLWKKQEKPIHIKRKELPDLIVDGIENFRLNISEGLYMSQGNFIPYFVGIMKRLWKSRIRQVRKNNKGKSHLNELPERVDEQEEDNFQEKWDKIVRAREQLGEECNRVIDMRLEGMPYTEISKIIGKKVNATKTQYSRCIKKLRDIIQKWDEGQED